MDKKTGKRRIWIYKDKLTGKGKGEATITYDDPPTASSAINWFGGTIVNDQNLVSGHFYCFFYFLYALQNTSIISFIRLISVSLPFF